MDPNQLKLLIFIRKLPLSVGEQLFLQIFLSACKRALLRNLSVIFQDQYQVPQRVETQMTALARPSYLFVSRLSICFHAVLRCGQTPCLSSVATLQGWRLHHARGVLPPARDCSARRSLCKWLCSGVGLCSQGYCISLSWCSPTSTKATICLTLKLSRPTGYYCYGPELRASSYMQ